MSEQENVRRVQSLYGHTDTEGYFLGRAALWDLLADDVEWWAAGPPDRLPWAGTVRGHEGVRGWMAVLNERMEYTQFDPLEYVAQGDTVVEVVMASGRAISTGRSFASEIVRIWTFRDGKAVKVRSYYDTAAYVVALQGA
jgi:ketosteroid isomerase-like protein